MPPPRVTIINGAADELIPVTMGRSLAAEFPSIVSYVEVSGADHNGVIFANRALLDALEQDGGVTP